VKKVLRFSNVRTAAALLFTGLLFLPPNAAHGHAYPDHADPKVGASVAGSPAVIRIWFDGDLEPAFSTITVQDGNGIRVDKGDGHVYSSDATLLEISLPPLPPGTYRVTWDVVAKDTHRTRGYYTFTVR